MADSLKKYAYFCDCKAVEHQLVIEYFEGEEPSDDALSFQVHLHPARNFFRRVWYAIRYVCGYRAHTWDAIELRPDQAFEIGRFLMNYKIRHGLKFVDGKPVVEQPPAPPADRIKNDSMSF